MHFYCILMVGLLVLPGVLQVQAQPQDTVFIETGGSLWNKTVLTVLIVSDNQSAGSSFVDSTIRAIDDWNHAIMVFSTNYSGFNYLSAVTLQAQVSNQTKPDFDIYVNFTESIDSGSQDAIGTTTTIPYGNGTIKNCVITLATQPDYVAFTQKDVQSVATHEFGHALGIGHCNSSSDLMYPLFDVYANQYEISTLELYGVADAFQWIINPNQQFPSAKQELSLPADIDYEYIPSAQPAPQTIVDNPVVRALETFVNVLLTPYILMIIVVGVSLIVIIELYYRRKQKSEK